MQRIFSLCFMHDSARPMPQLLCARRKLMDGKEKRTWCHVGGSADVAHKDLDDSPRKMVLRNKPIQLSSAVLDLSSGSHADGAHTAQGKEEPSIRVLNLTANSRLSGDGILPASRRYGIFQTSSESLIAQMLPLTNIVITRWEEIGTCSVLIGRREQIIPALSVGRP